MHNKSLFRVSAIVVFFMTLINANEASKKIYFLDFLSKLQECKKEEIAGLLNDTESLETLAVYFKGDIQELPTICPPALKKFIDDLEKKDRNITTIMNKLIDLSWEYKEINFNRIN